MKFDAPSVLKSCRGADVPENEPDRVAALHDLGILDTKPSVSYDRIVNLIVAAIKAPIAVVCFVDSHRQWFKASVGLNVQETSREVSFCAHAIRDEGPFAVEDAIHDPRFCTNTLVTGAPGIQAYLGIPIRTQAGLAVGTVCAIDTLPRTFSTEQVALLTDLARLTEDLIHAGERERELNRTTAAGSRRCKLFEDTFDFAAVGILHLTLTGYTLRANARACELLGYRLAELKEFALLDITHPDDVASDMAAFEKAQSDHADSYRIEKRIRCKDERYVWTSLSISLQKENDEGHPYIIAVLDDIGRHKTEERELEVLRETLHHQVTEQMSRSEKNNRALLAQIKKVLHSEQQLKETEHRLRAVTNTVPALIGYWNRDLTCEFANEPYREWFNIDPKRILGMSMRDLLGVEHFRTAEPHVRNVLAGNQQRFEQVFSFPDGTQRIQEVRYVPDLGQGGRVEGFYVLAVDITDVRQTQRALEAANAQLQRESLTDYLTGLSNRRVFTERSEQAAVRFAQRQEVYGLVLVDIDNFKQINDAFGHDVGDEVLRRVGKVMKSQLRSHRDVVARLGGEEFAMLCFGSLDMELLKLVADSLRDRLNSEVIEGGSKRLQFTASYGIALSSQLDLHWKNIYTRADAALYEAKQAGKDRIVAAKTAGHMMTGKFRALRAVSAD